MERKQRAPGTLFKRKSSRFLARSDSRSVKQESAKAYKLTVHSYEFNNGEELVLNPEAFPNIQVTRSLCVH